MGVESRLLKSRLARRFFAMFVVCALLPIVVLALFAYFHVTRQLTDQSFDRLRQSAKSFGLSIHEHLAEADDQLLVIQTLLNLGTSTLPPAVEPRNEELFSGIAFYRNTKTACSWGESISPAEEEKISSLDFGQHETTLLSLEEESGWPKILLARKVTEGEIRGTLVGVLKSARLWGEEGGSTLPPASEFVVREGSRGRFLYSSIGHLDEIKRPLSTMGKNSKERTEFSIGGKLYYFRSWSIFLKGRFHVSPWTTTNDTTDDSSWTMTVMEPREYVLEPMHYFRAIFPAIICLSIVAILWLGGRAIRRSLTPIDSLMVGVREVSLRHFDHKVAVKSNDEFRDLADAFNRMTRQLDTQFNALAARAHLDQAILSLPDLDKITTTGLEWAKKVFPQRTMSISIVSSHDPIKGQSYVRADTDEEKLAVSDFQMTDNESRLLLECGQWLLVANRTPLPSYLHVIESPGVDAFVVLPIFTQDRFFGFVSFGADNELIADQDALRELREFSDHLAVAFFNSHLVRELKGLNIGTLHALARTVDAKSPWTAGHSQRVSEMTVDVGMAMGLSDEIVADLQRASLLHDIGKISIPAHLLDKQTKLSNEEQDVIKSHPSVGARILDPIKAYARLIPLVEEHHERFDGNGYPRGIAGDAIHLGARIIAVVDSFDAMVSDRPYRKGLSWGQALNIVRKEAGYQFDPKVVEVFNRVVVTWERANRRESGLHESVITAVVPSAVAERGGDRTHGLTREMIPDPDRKNSRTKEGGIRLE
jgi:putative nucleotidyltransferase with HDIG domain